MNYIVIDIGGTNTRIGITEGSRVVGTTKFSTPQSYAEAVDVIQEQVVLMQGDREVTNICCGIPGTLNQGNRHIVRTPNLPGWSGQNFAEDLEVRLPDVNVHLFNDTELLALGEAIQVEFADYAVIGYLAIGTGVGGARIVNHKIDVNRFGFEPGHQIISYESGLDLEQVAGGRSIMEETGKKPHEIEDPAFWEPKYKALAAGVYNTILHWSPDALVFGGGMFDEEIYQIPKLRDELEEINQLLPQLPALHQGVLDDDAGLIGAAHYLHNLHG